LLPGGRRVGVRVRERPSDRERRTTRRVGDRDIRVRHGNERDGPSRRTREPDLFGRKRGKRQRTDDVAVLIGGKRSALRNVRRDGSLVGGRGVLPAAVDAFIGALYTEGFAVNPSTGEFRRIQLPP